MGWRVNQERPKDVGARRRKPLRSDWAPQPLATAEGLVAQMSDGGEAPGQALVCSMDRPRGGAGIG